MNDSVPNSLVLGDFASLRRFLSDAFLPRLSTSLDLSTFKKNKMSLAIVDCELIAVASYLSVYL